MPQLGGIFKGPSPDALDNLRFLKRGNAAGNDGLAQLCQLEPSVSRINVQGKLERAAINDERQLLPRVVWSVGMLLVLRSVGRWRVGSTRATR